MDFLQDQLITYIGNKKKIIRFYRYSDKSNKI